MYKERHQTTRNQVVIPRVQPMTKSQKDIEDRQLNAFLGSTAGITAAASFSMFAATNPVAAIALLGAGTFAGQNLGYYYKDIKKPIEKILKPKLQPLHVSTKSK